MSADVVRTIVILGKPGSGKYTQAKRLADKLGYRVFSTGDQFRELRKRTDTLGAKVREVYDQGLLFPGWFAGYLFEDVLFALDSNDGIIFEGMGRSLEEVRLFDEVTRWLGRDYVAVELQISDEEVLKRHAARGRDVSDEPEQVKIRLQEYEEKTVPAISFFRERGNLLEVNGEQTRDAVFTSLCEVLNI